MIIYKSDLLRALEFCSSDNERPSLAGVQIEEWDGKIIIASTDTYRLHEVTATPMRTAFPQYEKFFPNCTTKNQDAQSLIDACRKAIALDKKTPKIKLGARAQIHNGEEFVNVPSTYKGDHEDTIVNAELLLDVLKKIPKDSMQSLAIGSETTLGPLLITFWGDRHIIMPLKS